MRDLVSKQSVEWAVSLWVRVRGKMSARIAWVLVAAAVAVVSNALPIVVGGLFAAFGKEFTIPEVPSWIAAIFATLAIVLLVAERFVPEKMPSPNPHDVRLLREFQALMTQDVRSFLSERRFGTAWPRVRLNAVGTLADTWKGARYEFEDPELQSALEQAISEARSLEDKQEYMTYPHLHVHGLQTAHTEDDDRRGLQPQTIANIRELNETGVRLVEAIDALNRIARRKIPPSKP